MMNCIILLKQLFSFASLLHLCQNKIIVSTEQTKFHNTVLILLHDRKSLSDAVFVKITYSTLQNFFSSLLV